MMERVSRLVDDLRPDLRNRLRNHFAMQSSRNDEPLILIHHSTTSVQDKTNNHGTECNEQKRTHHIHFGFRTSVGPAGTKGAPSQTLRRTHRGLLKQYALKHRYLAIVHGARNQFKIISIADLGPPVDGTPIELERIVQATTDRLYSFS